MRTLLLSFFILQFLFCSAQSPSKSEAKKSPIAYLRKPEFPGGEIAMYKYIYENIKYPERAIHSDQQGLVRVTFVLQKDGTITNIEIKRPLGFGMDEEAIRMIKKMPKWKPAKYKGKAIPYVYLLPIEFKLV
jgi:periplasmic protein TonB